MTHTTSLACGSLRAARRRLHARPPHRPPHREAAPQRISRSTSLGFASLRTAKRRLHVRGPHRPPHREVAPQRISRSTSLGFASLRAAKRRLPNKRRRGFTLIEIMAVVLIIGLLIGLVGTQVFQQVGAARVGTTRAQIWCLEASLGFYQMDNGRFPTTEQGLDALVHKPSGAPVPRNWRTGGYVKGGAVPKDAWGGDFQYESPGTNNTDSFDLWSLGADGAPGGNDNDADIGNWASEAAAE